MGCPKSTLQRFKALTLLTAGLLLSGCAGYKLGPTNGAVAREKSVQINPFSDQTLQPPVTDAFAQQLRKELQRAATYTPADSFSIYDILSVRDSRLVLSARVTARERSTGKVIFERGDSNPVTGYTLIRVGSDLTSAERQAMPLLAQDLARNVTALLVDGSW